jgi:hypothetical protein
MLIINDIFITCLNAWSIKQTVPLLSRKIERCVGGWVKHGVRYECVIIIDIILYMN